MMKLNGHYLNTFYKVSINNKCLDLSNGHFSQVWFYLIVRS